MVDSQCPGSVITDAATYNVDWVPRPSAKLSVETKAIHETYNGSYIIPPICEGVDSHVDLELTGEYLCNNSNLEILNKDHTGKPPFQISYNIAKNSEHGGTTLLNQPSFNSIQPRTRFQLHTSDPGRIYYEVKQIGDAEYPLQTHKNSVIPRAERLLFEQEVWVRPSARFKTTNRMAYCLNDAFVPQDTPSMGGLVELEGTPPFVLDVSIKNPAASHFEIRTIELSEKLWGFDLPSYIFKAIGPHLVTIQSVQDASHCAPAPLDPLAKSIWVDVAESAAIVPYDRREHYCVGDISLFQLEGTPPWTVGYVCRSSNLTRY